MSLDLGIRHWKLVGVVDGAALFTHARESRSRWVDLTAWPGKLQTAREEWTRDVCRGAVLVGWTQQAVYVEPRKRIELPSKQHGFRAIGKLGDRVLVVPGDLEGSPLHRAPQPMLYDGAWRALDGRAGGDPARAAVVALDDGRALVVWGGRVLLFDGALAPTDAGDLSAGSGIVPTGDGFITVAGGKLVTITRAGKQREDRPVGKLALASVMRYEDRLLLFDGRRHYLYDDGKHERLDLGSSLDDPETLIAAPCGLVGLVDEGRTLIRLRV